MIFLKYTIDFEITPELLEKYGEDLQNQAYANFCISYVNQIKNKLNFTSEKTKGIKQEKDKDDKTKINQKEVDVYRFSMDMITIRNKASNQIVNKKPKFVFNGKESREG